MKVFLFDDPEVAQQLVPDEGGEHGDEDRAEVFAAQREQSQRHADEHAEDPDELPPVYLADDQHEDPEHDEEHGADSEREYHSVQVEEAHPARALFERPI